MITQYRSCYACFQALLIVLTLSGCGDSETGTAAITNSLSDGGSSGGGGSGGEAQSTTIFVAVKSHDQSNRSSFYSNEIQASYVENTSATLSWSEPTRKLGDECLSSSDLPLSYTIGIGQSSGVYLELDADTLATYGQLVCGQATSSTDDQCSGAAITRCTYTLDALPL